MYNDVGQLVMKIENTIDLKNNIQTTNNNGNYKMEWKIPNKEKYENGSYMYNLFPEIIQNNFKRKLVSALKINFLRTQKIKDQKAYSLMINDLKINLDKELHTPIFYTNGEMNSNSRKYYNIKLNCVEDKDVSIKK